ncbi:MAG: hypothetical protein Q9184_005730 [Pyrenodesmia sp. 2 TL-2023]
MAGSMGDYRAVKREGGDDHEETALGDDSNGYDYSSNVQRHKWHFHKLLIPISLLVSLMLNAVLVTRLNTRASPTPAPLVSKFGRQNFPLYHRAQLIKVAAKLEFNVPTPFSWHTDYNGDDQALANDLWDALGAEIDSGFIAVTDEWAAANDLLEAQRFPWDTTKGIYLVNGQHNLHCLKNIRSAYMEYHTGRNQSKTFPHINHCFDALRQDIMCQADDTPRYTTTTDDPESGVGQVRQCRSWEQLQRWRRERTACFRNIHEGERIHEMERYKFCPPGSEYLPKVRGYFKKGDEWEPTVDVEE